MGDRENILSKVAINIRIERYKKKMTQESLAEKVGVSTKYINLIENKHINPSIVVVVKICDALGIELNKLLKDYNE